MDADEHTRATDDATDATTDAITNDTSDAMTDEERAEFLRRSHMKGLTAAVAMGLLLIVTLILMTAFGDHTPMCGTGQDMGPC
ncbi:hypothetical protein SGFS_068940 [Streptomyces graminofaciens]|uniref:Uncharacterized protein n=1 Tax=Streptomyces graminofaciens TaxID=68212 RepID=A0ABM7FGQ2_9ACTN|nr:hypothetical protein [Streptomyces graminofaciens]BBC35600.1 hypothetical protein SGFS_068940 [Streptomyces graminofaciens]